MATYSSRDDLAFAIEDAARGMQERFPNEGLNGITQDELEGIIDALMSLMEEGDLSAEIEYRTVSQWQPKFVEPRSLYGLAERLQIPDAHSLVYKNSSLRGEMKTSSDDYQFMADHPGNYILEADGTISGPFSDSDKSAMDPHLTVYDWLKLDQWGGVTEEFREGDFKRANKDLRIGDRVDIEDGLGDDGIVEYWDAGWFVRLDTGELTGPWDDSEVSKTSSKQANELMGYPEDDMEEEPMEDTENDISTGAPPATASLWDNASEGIEREQRQAAIQSDLTEAEPVREFLLMAKTHGEYEDRKALVEDRLAKLDNRKVVEASLDADFRKQAALWDIVAYDYKADRYCPEHILEAMGHDYSTAHLGRTVEDVLTTLAEIEGIDRFDEYSYDSGEFPKVVFRDQISGYDTCGMGHQIEAKRKQAIMDGLAEGKFWVNGDQTIYSDRPYAIRNNIGTVIYTQVFGQEVIDILTEHPSYTAEPMMGSTSKAGKQGRPFGSKTSGSSYRDDPKWITTRYDGRCEVDGHGIRAGEEAFYFPIGKKLYCKEHGQTHSNRFDMERADEDFYNRQYKKAGLEPSEDQLRWIEQNNPAPGWYVFAEGLPGFHGPFDTEEAAQLTADSNAGTASGQVHTPFVYKVGKKASHDFPTHTIDDNAYQKGMEDGMAQKDPDPDLWNSDPNYTEGFEDGLTKALTGNFAHAKNAGWVDKLIREDDIPPRDQDEDEMDDSATASKKVAKEWTPQEAWDLVGNQSTDMLKMMQKALNMMPRMNTPEENERLDAVNYILKNKVKNPRFSKAKKASQRYDIAKQVVESRTAGELPGGILLDSFTASALVQVYEALSPESQAKFDDIPLDKLVAFVMSHVSVKKNAGILDDARNEKRPEGGCLGCWEVKDDIDATGLCAECRNDKLGVKKRAVKITADFLKDWIYKNWLSKTPENEAEVDCMLSNKQNWEHIEAMAERYRGQRWGEDDELDADDMGVDDALGFAITGLVEGGHGAPHKDNCPLKDSPYYALRRQLSGPSLRVSAMRWTEESTGDSDSMKYTTTDGNLKATVLLFGPEPGEVTGWAEWRIERDGQFVVEGEEGTAQLAKARAEDVMSKISVKKKGGSTGGAEWQLAGGSFGPDTYFIDFPNGTSGMVYPGTGSATPTSHDWEWEFYFAAGGMESGTTDTLEGAKKAVEKVHSTSGRRGFGPGS